MVHSLEKMTSFGLFFSMAARADFIRSSLWIMLMFHEACGGANRWNSVLTNSTMMWLRKVTGDAETLRQILWLYMSSPCSPVPLPHCGLWNRRGWFWCPAQPQGCGRRSPRPSPELRPSWPPYLRTLGWGGKVEDTELWVVLLGNKCLISYF